jgi:hypothetical protein
MTFPASAKINKNLAVRRCIVFLTQKLRHHLLEASIARSIDDGVLAAQVCTLGGKPGRNCPPDILPRRVSPI